MGRYGWSHDIDDDDAYDAEKDAYHEGWGAPYNDRTRQEVQDEMDNDRDNGWTR